MNPDLVSVPPAKPSRGETAERSSHCHSSTSDDDKHHDKKAHHKLRLENNPSLESPRPVNPLKSGSNKLRSSDRPVLESPSSRAQYHQPPRLLQAPNPPELDDTLIEAEVAPNYEDEIQAARDCAIRDVEEAHRQMASIQVATAETVPQSNKRMQYVCGAVAVILAVGITAAVFLLPAKDDSSGETITNNNSGDEHNILQQYFVENAFIQVFGAVNATYNIDCAVEATDIGVVARNSTSATEECIGLLPLSSFESVCESNDMLEVELNGDYRGFVLGLGFLRNDIGLDCSNSGLDSGTGLVLTSVTSTPAPTTQHSSPRRNSLEVILAEYAPLHEPTMTWLAETDTWEPEEGDPNTDYLWLERYAMGVLYHETSGDNWVNSSEWLSSGPVCDWAFREFPSCDRGPITILDLNGFGLAGSIPPVLFELTALLKLDLGENDLTGSIPSTIDKLHEKLQYLSLYGNSLTGSIPWTSIMTMQKLTDLDLDQNQLTGRIPSEIGRLERLEFLYLGHNLLTSSIPSSIGDLSSLVWLTLGNNDISGEIPSEMGNLSRLTMLSLHTNYLTGNIPHSIGLLTRLTYLDLNSNQIAGSIPHSIGLLTRLTGLSVGYNRLTGTFPSFNLPSLLSLEIQWNQLSGSIPSSVENLNQLETLDVEKNQLIGRIDSLATLTRLQNLWLAKNLFTGAMPAFSREDFPSLTSLALKQNLFHGSIPESFTTLTRLEYLLLGDNGGMAGSLPPSIGNLTRLSVLYMPDMGLTGTIPESFGSLSTLRDLWLYDNDLSGPIPVLPLDTLNTCELWGNCFDLANGNVGWCSVSAGCE